MDLPIFALLTQDGVTNGAVYALLALALVLVFTVTRVICVPSGEFVAYGTLTLAGLQLGKPPAHDRAPRRDGGRRRRHGGRCVRAQRRAAARFRAQLRAWTGVPRRARRRRVVARDARAPVLGADPA